MSEKNCNCVVLDNGWLLFPDGDMRENSNSQYATLRKPENDLERCRLIVLYWQKKLELSVAEFDDRKSRWLASARAKLKSDGNPGGLEVTEEEAVAVLNTMKSKINHCREQLTEAEKELEQVTPRQLKQTESITEANRTRNSDFVSAIESIEI